jgi:hypothetical protein
MRRHLWIHRDLEILQNLITRYAFGHTWLTKDRVHIQWQWNNIQKDMEEALKDADELVKRNKELSVRHPKTGD